MFPNNNNPPDNQIPADELRQWQPVGLVPLVAAQPTSTTTTRMRFSISSARIHYKQREFAEAVLNYIAVLKQLPAIPGDGRRKFICEFLAALREYLRQESNDNRAEQILQIAQSIYPAESALYRSIAEHLFEKGKFMRCVETFGRAMDCARDELEWLHAASCQENARSNLFDAWHWRMLNDGRRNARFAEAILAALESRRSKGLKTRVLDIGSGSGIFSVVAAYSTANPECMACERDELMCSVSRRTFRRNGAQARGIELFEMDSKKLQLAEPCDLLVTETLDCAIFGERIVETILDAKKRLLNEDAIIIPSKAVAIFSLLESDYLAQENAFECPTAPISLLSTSCYIRDSPILPPSPYNCAFLDQLPSPSSSSCTSSAAAAPYRLLSDPVEGQLVDFNNVQQLLQINTDRMITEVIIRAKDRGVASSVCVWFRLHLFDQIELCTAPEEGLCWQQAIFPFYPPVTVAPGDALHFQVFIKDHALHVQPVIGCGPDPMPASRELLRAPPALDLLAMHDPAVRRFFARAVRSCQPLSQVVDCTDLLLELDNDTNPAGWSRIASVHPAIRYIGREGATSLDKAVCKPGGAILHWPFSAQGDLMDDYFASIIDLHLRSPGTMLIPNQIVLKGCLISSDQLVARCGLLTGTEEQRTVYCGVDLSPMGDYRLTHFQELETRTLQFQTLSEPVELFRMDFSGEAEHDLGQLTKLKHEAHLECAVAGRCDAILLWFQIGSSSSSGNLSPQKLDVALDLRLHTGCVKSFAFLLPSPIHLQRPNVCDDEGTRKTSIYGVKCQYSLHHGNVLFHCAKEAIFL